MKHCADWTRAFDLLRAAGLAKSNIRSYALIGFDAGPSEAWDRCKWIEKHGIKPSPMWFHELTAMKRDVVTDKQKAMGWTAYERQHIMQWFYKHRHAPKITCHTMPFADIVT